MKEGETKTTEHELTATARAWPGYAVAVGGTAIAALLRQALLPFGHDLPLFITFYPAVFAAAAVGGTGPGLLATILSTVAADLLFTEPRGKVVVTNPGQAVGIVLFIAVNIGISLLGGRLRKNTKTLSRQARLIDLAPAATLVRKPDGTITFWSQGAERLYGWKKEEALGRRTNDLLHTESSEPLESIVKKLNSGGTWTGELRRYTRNGRQVVVEGYCLAELNANGEVEELLESNTDITERKQLQEHLEDVVAERTAKLQEALADLEHMSYSMVHDMRAPLRAMQGFASLMQHECANDPQPLDYLHRIRESSNRLDRLITDALNYNKVVRENLPLTPVHLGKLLHGMVNSYPNLQPSAADITIDFDDVIVIGNESLLTQCFGNLLDNAVKFVAPGVKPRIRIWAEPSTIDQQPSTIIHTEDNGIGIPKHAHEKIFQMFQRMHGESEYPGTGIGLAIVRKAVERMAGRVILESEPGNGTRISIELPRPAQSQADERLEEAA